MWLKGGEVETPGIRMLVPPPTVPLLASVPPVLAALFLRDRLLVPVVESPGEAAG